MRAISIIVFAGCTSSAAHVDVPDAVRPDAATTDDGGIIDARVPGIDAPTSIAGVWQVTWSCTSGCAGEPPLTHSHLVEVFEDRVYWSDPTCTECTQTHTSSIVNGCARAIAATEGNYRRDAYTICAADGIANASLSFVDLYGPMVRQTWTIRGERR